MSPRNGGSGAVRDRRRAEAKGRWAEALAALLLRLKGFRVLDRRFRSPSGEIDLVVRRGRLLVFVEVKARGDVDAGIEAVGPRARRRITRAAETWIARHPSAAALDQRFDVVVVCPRRLPVHLAGIFRADD